MTEPRGCPTPGACSCPPAAAQPPAEVAWLIEDGTPGGRYYGGVGEHAGAWTTDHMRAIRYARREDAERAVMGLPNGWHLIGRAVEHMWGYTAAQPGEREREDALTRIEHLSGRWATVEGANEALDEIAQIVSRLRAAGEPGQ